ncbi:hypothetical protein CN13_04140 [Petrotoga sp. HKA.pet.4.5]|uniref:DUF4020 domain-containing protein n=1 Tax=unclassified Petrotoga TaxID=2620614 RepID=UPI000CCA127D|nr:MULTISPECIES: DUF4020 domain-containing protein [unclassified Petrotoga]PNR89086.1 hypothetical protein X925_04265 [Petrotoga sp. 9T1HF07.CasAA.8.2]RLL85125.1 hypothetical protein BZ25_01940 [Petrotoga sp. Shatin.DS.tank11.9.2.9.3]RLL89817.1 hypothetical protein CN13_04140 [Petrotoga sp. HKA.pet.4.5]
MWIGEIEVPEELINAQAERKLVIFAGAGVSMSPPSNLPNFEKLVREVESKTGNLLTWEPEKEAPDHFLGYLEGKGPKVHKLVWERIKNQESEPTELHYALLSLFRNPEEVRIVTTNFDTHFSKAAAKNFQGEVPIYRAPALPLGHQFNGIIYLHGCVDQKPEELILTDRDFGRAYLTEGWAARFLVGIFGNYKVLFVGYSHNDLPMEYLGRGLPPETERFALVPEDEIEKWKYKGIKLIPYKHSPDDQEHKALVESVKSWVNQTRMGLVEHEQRIKDLVQLPPSLDREEDSYIEEVIKDPIKVNIFTKYAERVEWLQWAEGKGVFKPLFSLNNPSDEISDAFAKWFAEKYACRYPEDALAVVQKQGQVLSPLLWKNIAGNLGFSESLPEPTTLAKWVELLLIAPIYPSTQGNSLDFLLQKCCSTEYATIAIRIFKYLSTPYLVLEPSGFKLTIPADDYLFSEAWKEFFKPNLKKFVHELAPIITGQLKSAHRLLCNVDCANDKWDPVSFKRSAIEPHEQDQYPGSLDLLIDFARDIIELLLKDDPERAQTTIQEWTLSNIPIFKRLAIYGVTIDHNSNPNEKLQKLLTNNWLFVHGLKHEVFQLLKVAYPKADVAVRQRLLENVETYLANCERNEKDPANLRSQNYEVYNLLYWLEQIAPNCSLVHQKFSEIQARHPDFQPREYPNLDWYISTEWVGPQSPVTVEELLSKPVSQIIEFLLTYQEKEILGLDREGLLSVIQKAVARSFLWGWKLIEELEAREEWDTDLWDAIISGWQSTNLTEAQWKEVLQFLEHFKEIWKHRYSITELLKEKVKANEGSLPTSLLPCAETIVDRLWQEVEKHDEKEILNHINDWLTTAINHVGGVITQFWVLALARHQSQKENERQGILDEYKGRFERIISAKSNTAAMGRVILASQLHFLFSLDHKWTREKILPLLDWNTDADAQRAEQAWEGYLRWGKWNEALLPDLLPLYEQAYNNLRRDSESYDLLCVHLASIAVRSSIDPIQSGWLDKFIENVDEKTRGKWAAEVTNQLTSLPQEAIKEIWNKWIRNYWSIRTDGIPLPLSPEEAGNMVDWVFALQPVFSEVVDLIVAKLDPVLKIPEMFYYRLDKENFAEKYPLDTTRLLNHLLKGETRPFCHCYEVIKLFNNISKNLPLDDIKPLKEHLIRLGCSPSS